MEDKIPSTECPCFSPICCISTSICMLPCSAGMIICCYSIWNNVALVSTDLLAVCTDHCLASPVPPDLHENWRFLTNGAHGDCPSPTRIFILASQSQKTIWLPSLLCDSSPITFLFEPRPRTPGNHQDRSDTSISPTPRLSSIC